VDVFAHCFLAVLDWTVVREGRASMGGALPVVPAGHRCEAACGRFMPEECGLAGIA